MSRPTISQIEFSRKSVADEAFTTLMELLHDRDRIPEPKYLEPVLVPGGSTMPSARSRKETESEDILEESVRKAISILQKSLPR